MKTDENSELQQLKEELEASELRYRRLFENARDGIILVDFETGMILDVNEFLIDLLGFSKAELLEKYLWDIGAFKDIAASKDHFKQLQAKKFIRYENLPLITKAGKSIPVEIVSYAYKVSDKETIQLIQCNVLDITQYRRTEELLSESEVELKEAQRLGRLGNWTWDIAADKITWSREYYRIFGIDPKQTPPGYEEHLKVYTPESAARLDEAVKKEMQTGEPYKLDLEIAEPKGTCRWITARSETIRNGEGMIIGLRGTAQNITERIQAEEELKASELKYATLVEKSNDGVLIFSDNGIFKFVNPRILEMTGYTKEEIIGTPFTNYMSPEYQKITMERYTKRLKGEDVPNKYEIEVIAKDGRKVQIEINASRIEYEGKPAVMAIVRDITERKKLEEEKSEQANKTAELLNSMVGRELKMVDLKKQIKELQKK